MISTHNEYLDAQGFIVEVIRTERQKTADLRVEDGAVSIVVPQRVSTEKIEKILTTK